MGSLCVVNAFDFRVMRNIYIVPFSERNLQNRFFDPNADPEVTSPVMQYAREYCAARGVNLQTFDMWNARDSRPDDVLVVFDHPPVGFYKWAYFLRDVLRRRFYYKSKMYGLGRFMRHFRERILLHWESPVNSPWVYSHLGSIAPLYSKLYFVPKAEGYGHLYLPLPFSKPFEDYFVRTERKFLVMMASYRRAKGFLKCDLYRERINVLEYFSRFDEIELYGEYWNKRPEHFLRKIHKGYVDDKFDTMSRYTFAICFENAIWPGYITEKIFACLSVGTIPVYLGATDITDDIPPECFIDMRQFKDYDELRNLLHSLTVEDIARYRAAAHRYFDSEKFRRFTKEHFAETLLSVVSE